MAVHVPVPDFEPLMHVLDDLGVTYNVIDLPVSQHRILPVNLVPDTAIRIDKVLLVYWQEHEVTIVPKDIRYIDINGEVNDVRYLEQKGMLLPQDIPAVLFEVDGEVEERDAFVEKMIREYLPLGPAAEKAVSANIPIANGVRMAWDYERADMMGHVPRVTLIYTDDDEATQIGRVTLEKVAHRRWRRDEVWIDYWSGKVVLVDAGANDMGVIRDVAYPLQNQTTLEGVRNYINNALLIFGQHYATQTS